MNNPNTGHKQVDIGGKTYTLRYTWRVLAAVSAEHGDNPDLFDVETVASVGAMGIDDPEITKERIMEISPPLIPFAKAVQEAMRWAYFGGIAPDGSGAVDQKKNLKTGGLWRRLKQLFRQD